MSSKKFDADELNAIVDGADKKEEWVQPLPGQPGGPLVGYAEAQRVLNPAPSPSHVVQDVRVAEDEFEKRSGKTVEEMTEGDFARVGVTFKSKDLTLMTDLHVVLKDKSMVPRWFNYKNGMGRSVSQAYMRGFRPVTKDDVEFCHARQSDENGALLMGDLACLMIPKVLLWGGIYKQNSETAKARVNRAMNAKTMNQNLADAGQGGLDKTNAEYFVPDIVQAQRVDAGEAQRLVYK